MDAARQSPFLAKYLPEGLAQRYFAEQLRRCDELRQAADPRPNLNGPGISVPSDPGAGGKEGIMARAMIVSAGASSNEYLSARLTELGYVRPVIVPQRHRSQAPDAGGRL